MNERPSPTLSLSLATLSLAMALAGCGGAAPPLDDAEVCLGKCDGE